MSTQLTKSKLRKTGIATRASSDDKPGPEKVKRSDVLWYKFEDILIIVIFYE